MHQFFSGTIARILVVLLALLNLVACSGGSDGGASSGSAPSLNLPELGLGGGVLTIAKAADGSGDVYLGGYFSSYNDTSSQGLIRMNSDGTVDSDFAVGSGFDSDVNTVLATTDGSGDIYVGGYFTHYNGSARNNIVRLNSDGSVDEGFVLGSGFDREVNIIVPASDGSGDIYVGGQFTNYNGTASNNIIRLNSDGSVDNSFAVGTGFIGSITTITAAADGSGDIYVGGGFISYNGTAINKIIRLHSDGTIDSSFAVGYGFDYSVSIITAAADGSGDIYVGGWFGKYNGTASNSLIRLHSDGSVDNNFALGTSLYGSVYTIAAAADGSGDIYVGGGLRSYNGTAINNIIRLRSDSSVDSSFTVGSGFDSTVHSIVPASDALGGIYVGGDFTTYNGTPSGNVIRLADSGAVNMAYSANVGFNDEVNDIALATDGSGDLYAGGYFTHYNGASSNGIIRLNSNGTVDSRFAVGTGFDREVETIVPVAGSSGDIYVGGWFTRYNDTDSNRIIRLNSDGTIDSGFATGYGFDYFVSTIVPAADGSGDIYVGGGFNNYNGTAGGGLIRLHSDGSVESSFAVGSGFNTGVTTVVPAADGSGDIYAGGYFSSYNGVTTGKGLIRLHSDGSVDSSFVVGSGVEGRVLTIVPAADGSGDVYVGGNFISYNGTPSNKIIRLHSDGSLDSSFAVGSGFNNSVDTITPVADGSGDIYVGGEFTSYNGATSNGIVRLNSDGTVDSGFAVGSGFGLWPYVYTIVPAPGTSGGIYVGGWFTSYQDTTVSHVVLINADGTIY